jgi:moderate conductance mechanosensitive channel
MAAMVLADSPLSDFSHWARGNGLEIVLFIIGAELLARGVRWLGGTITARIDAAHRTTDAVVRTEAAKHRHAVAQVLTWVTVVMIYVVAAIVIADRLGIPVAGLVAPATVAGVALGFGAQRIVQDILAGFFIITERQYGFGDLIRISALGSSTGVTGTVEEVTLRITRIRSSNGEVIIVPNGQIVQVTNLSRDWARAVVDVPVPVAVDVNRVNEILHDVGVDAFADEGLKPLLLDAPTVMGVESLEVDELKVRLVARTLPGQQFEVSRELRQRIVQAFRQHGISERELLETPAVVDAG